jgi:hypothetical protein
MKSRTVTLALVSAAAAMAVPSAASAAPVTVNIVPPVNSSISLAQLPGVSNVVGTINQTGLGLSADGTFTFNGTGTWDPVAGPSMNTEAQLDLNLGISSIPWSGDVRAAFGADAKYDAPTKSYHADVYDQLPGAGRHLLWWADQPNPLTYTLPQQNIQLPDPLSGQALAFGFGPVSFTGTATLDGSVEVQGKAMLNAEPYGQLQVAAFAHTFVGAQLSVNISGWTGSASISMQPLEDDPSVPPLPWPATNPSGHVANVTANAYLTPGTATGAVKGTTKGDIVVCGSYEAGWDVEEAFATSSNYPGPLKALITPPSFAGAPPQVQSFSGSSCYDVTSGSAVPAGFVYLASSVPGIASAPAAATPPSCQIPPNETAVCPAGWNDTPPEFTIDCTADSDSSDVVFYAGTAASANELATGATYTTQYNPSGGQILACHVSASGSPACKTFSTYSATYSPSSGWCYTSTSSSSGGGYTGGKFGCKGICQ